MKPKNKFFAFTILTNLVFGNLLFPLGEDKDQLSFRIVFSLTSIFLLLIALLGLRKIRSITLHLLTSLTVTLLVPILGTTIWMGINGLDPLRGGLGAIIGIIFLWKFTAPMLFLNFILFYLYRTRS